MEEYGAVVRKLSVRLDDGWRKAVPDYD